MIWLHAAACLFGGAFLVNGVPHFVSGVMGRAFQSPFARPPGQGLSSATINVVWGFANFLFAYLLLACVVAFDFHNTIDVVAFGGGALIMGVMSARLFGRFHGGDLS